MDIDFTFLYYGLLFLALLGIMLRAVKVINTHYKNAPRTHRETYHQR